MANKSFALKTGAGLSAAVAVILGGIYADEGGYVNHKADRGGETRYGVTIKVARAAGYLGPMKDFPMHCTGTVKVCADIIYTKQYMRDPGFLPIIEADAAVGDELVNTAVNTGPARPARWLQQSVTNICPSYKITADAKIGPATLAAFKGCQAKVGKVKFCRTMLDSLDAKQLAFYEAIVANNPSQRVFLKGWKAHRIGNVDRARCVAH